MKDFQDLLQRLSEFKGISSSSKEVGKRYVFVAVRGLTVDGHKYIDEAVKKGAICVIGEEDLPTGLKVEYIKVPDSRLALGLLASEWNGNPSQKLKVIGVTGTDGKTTTSSLIYHILKGCGKKVGLISTVSAKIGDEEYDTGFHVTNPDPVPLQKFLKNMVDIGCEYAIFEVTSHGIAQRRITGTSFDITVLTNITHEHLDYHKTLEAYMDIKLSFIDMAKSMAFLNEDDESFSYAKEKMKNKGFTGYSRTEDLKGILPGDYNESNAAAAVAVATFLGIERQKAISLVRSFKFPIGRLEKIESDKDFDVYVDFAHTPNALKNALEYLRKLAPNKLIAVFGSAAKRDEAKRPLMGEAAASASDVIVLTAEDPRGEDVMGITSQIRKGMGSKNVEIHEIPDREDAIKFAIQIAKKGDVIGIFGKGHEKAMNIDGINEIPWSDQEIVRKYL